jgi:hypothetical protein
LFSVCLLMRTRRAFRSFWPASSSRIPRHRRVRSRVHPPRRAAPHDQTAPPAPKVAASRRSRPR